MEIKKTKFVRNSFLNKSKAFRRSRVTNLRQEKFKMVMKMGNTTGIIDSELCRLTKEERRKWFEEELERGNPVLLDIQQAIRDSYTNRILRGKQN
jgi:hypothetical protein